MRSSVGCPDAGRRRPCARSSPGPPDSSAAALHACSARADTRSAASCATAAARQTSSRPGFELHEGDVLDAASLRGAGEGVDVAYYLVHSMGRGGDRGDFAERERQAASDFARMARAEGVERVVYLGGLGRAALGAPAQPRRDRAQVLAAEGPPLTYLRAAMVIGAASESYRMLRYLVRAAAGDDRPGLAAQPHAADRRGRRARVPGPGGESGPRRRRPRGADRRRRRADLRRAARPDGRRARQAPPAASCPCRCSRRSSPRTGSGWSRRWTPAWPSR